MSSENTRRNLITQKNNTELPEEPDMDKINDFVMSINERIVGGNVFD